MLLARIVETSQTVAATRSRKAKVVALAETLRDADAGDIEVAGARRLASALPTWFRWSPWADVTRERANRGGRVPLTPEPAAEDRRYVPP